MDEDDKEIPDYEGPMDLDEELELRDQMKSTRIN
jgi:hypothetical protein